MSFLLGKTKEELITDDLEEVDEFNAAMFMEYAKKVGRGYPVAYVTGQKEFYDLDFFVDERVLIPRPETELVVEKALEYLNSARESKERFRILDVGTGSGNIPVAIAANFDCDAIAEIVALDISEGAVEVAKINVAQHGFENTMNVFESDLLEAVDNGESFDLITANLPYIGTQENNFVEENVLKNEPALALYAGNNGTELYKKMFQQIADKGVDFERMIGEFGFGQRKIMEEILNKYFEHKWQIFKDLAGIDRVFVVRR